MIKNVAYSLIQIALITAVFALLSSCQKSSRKNTHEEAKPKAAVIIDQDLVPTFSHEEDDSEDSPVIVRNGVSYQAPQKKIQNPQAELILGRVKVDQAKASYDPGTRKMNITGRIRIFNAEKKEITSTEFEISGSHEATKSMLLLKGNPHIKQNSSLKPVVRASVTCLSINDADEYDCSRAAIDFFVAYKKETYTEQMELAQKTTPPKPTPPKSPESTTPADDQAANADHDDETQTEGEETSLDGRYQGHAETADLKTIFADDEDSPIEEVKPTPTPVPADPVKPAPPVVVNPPDKPATPTQPAPTTPPEAKPETPEKKEKQLSQDLQQLRNGDIRQINQAIGFPNDGRLRNATSILTKQETLKETAFFEVGTPSRNRHFGTYEMAEFISRLGKNLYETHDHKLFVGNISQKSGGKVLSLKNGKPQYDKKGNPILAHASHQNGVDADLGYPTTNDNVKFPVVVQMSTRQYNPSSYSVEKTYTLLKYAFNQSDIKIDRIFMDRTIKKALCEYANSKKEFKSADSEIVQKIFNSIDHVEGHGDHFHVRLKCSTYDPACRQKIYSVNPGCG